MGDPDHPAGLLGSEGWAPPPPRRQLGSFSLRRGHFPSFKREKSWSECETSKTKHGRWQGEPEASAGATAATQHPGLSLPFRDASSKAVAPLHPGAGAPPGPRVSVAAVPRAPLLCALATKVPADRHSALPGRPGRHKGPYGHQPPVPADGDSSRQCVRV